MNIILDTHSLIWYSENSNKLTLNAYNYINDENNNCLISMVSIWEMSIKLKINKLNLEGGLIKFIEELISRDFKILDIKLTHVLHLDNLELIHNDPFDRLLIAQSLNEKYPIISKDLIFDNYGINRIW
jgi:PIN domain nuclease of toxin-antitoxin system